MESYSPKWELLLAFQKLLTILFRFFNDTSAPQLRISFLVLRNLKLSFLQRKLEVFNNYIQNSQAMFYPVEINNNEIFVYK